MRRSTCASCVGSGCGFQVFSRVDESEGECTRSKVIGSSREV
jgi:hypothetical protein